MAPDTSGRLAGKVAVVTGGARGIGRATAELFRDEGARVFIWDLEAGDAGAQDMIVDGVDVADAAAVGAAAGRLAAQADGLDILINNAGVNLARSPQVGDVRPEEWRRLLDVNLSGALHCTQALLPLLKRSGAGRIVNFSSILAVAGFPGQSAYAATKAGLLGLTRVWARELGPVRDHRQRGRAGLHRHRDEQRRRGRLPQGDRGAHRAPPPRHGGRRGARLPLPRLRRRRLRHRSGDPGRRRPRRLKRSRRAVSGVATGRGRLTDRER